MKNFVEHLSTYAEYHRDPRNIMTHLFGVPLIVFAVTVLLSRPGFELAGMTLTPAILVFGATMVFYLRLNLVFALLMTILMGAGVYAADKIAAMSTQVYLAVGLGGFIVGWIIQFVGHYYEGKKPAFVDDLVGLLIGPLFVTAEIFFALGMFKNLKSEIENRAGVVRKSPSKTASA